MNNNTTSFKISFDNFKNVYVTKIKKDQMLVIEYRSDSIVDNKNLLIAIPGIQDVTKWINTIENAKKIYDEEVYRKEQLTKRMQDEQNRLTLEKEQKAFNFYQNCYSFHIKKSTPTYNLFSDKNKIALIYIDNNKALNFLKIDGYAEEENNGVISYNNIHYYEKAGNVSYVTDIHGNYTSYGGSITGGNFSKLATIGGGLLFGAMGMAAGAAFTYKPTKQEGANTAFNINSDIKKIDDRNIILKLYMSF